ncbi:MAG: hypothetical protein ABIO70_28495 [Pseudomonadota bacterium]
MAIIHFSKREIEARIVYWGPALSGKTTSLRALHAFTPRGRRGQLETLDTVDERTVYFDYLPLMWGAIAGFQGRVKVVGVPGQPLYQQTRRLLLRGADAVVFVADSGAQRLSANVESLSELQQALTALGRSLDEIPMVLQYNKRDLADALPVKVLQLGLNARDLPWFETVAIEGGGVADTFQALFELLSRRIERELASGGGDLVRGSGGMAPLSDEEEVRQTLGEVIAVRSAEEAGERRGAPGPSPQEAAPAPEEPPPAPADAPALAPLGAPSAETAAEALPAERTEEEPLSTEEAVPPGFEELGQEQRTDPLLIERPASASAVLPVPAPEQPSAEAPPAEAIPLPTPRAASRYDDPAPPYAVVTLPYLPRALQGCEVHSVADPILEQDDTVILRLTLREPQSGRHRRVRVRLVAEPSEQQSRPFVPDPAPRENYRAMMLITALVSFAFGVGASWVFFQH